MSRLLAIDYGKKRTGIAVSDPLQIIANGLTTVDTHNLMVFLKDYFLKENVEKVIIGHPKQMNNEASENMNRIEAFVALFKKKFPSLPIEYYDERFTSKIAQRALIDGGASRKQRQNKALIDEVSATIILQSYMESCRSNM